MDPVTLKVYPRYNFAASGLVQSKTKYMTYAKRICSYISSYLIYEEYVQSLYRGGFSARGTDPGSVFRPAD